jgi:hypothetical protein
MILRGPKSTFDTKKQIELDLSIPEARRDHSMCFHDKSNVVVMIGGWNALEWHPDQVALEIWHTHFRYYLPNVRLAMETGHLGRTSQGIPSIDVEVILQIMIQKRTLSCYLAECSVTPSFLVIVSKFTLTR